MYPPVGAVPGQAMLISARADAVALTSLVIWCLGERSESRSKRVRADRRKLRRPADDRAAATEINGAPSAKGPAHLARALCSPGVRSVPARASDCSSRLRAKICALPILFVQRHRSNKSSRFVVHRFLRVRVASCQVSCTSVLYRTQHGRARSTRVTRRGVSPDRAVRASRRGRILRQSADLRYRGDIEYWE
jgi:hypothetical protein